MKTPRNMRTSNGKDERCDIIVENWKFIKEVITKITSKGDRVEC